MRTQALIKNHQRALNYLNWMERVKGRIDEAKSFLYMKKTLHWRDMPAYLQWQSISDLERQVERWETLQEGIVYRYFDCISRIEGLSVFPKVNINCIL